MVRAAGGFETVDTPYAEFGRTTLVEAQYGRGKHRRGVAEGADACQGRRGERPASKQGQGEGSRARRLQHHCTASGCCFCPSPSATPSSKARRSTQLQSVARTAPADTNGARVTASLLSSLKTAPLLEAISHSAGAQGPIQRSIRERVSLIYARCALYDKRVTRTGCAFFLSVSKASYSGVRCACVRRGAMLGIVTASSDAQEAGAVLITSRCDGPIVRSFAGLSSWRTDDERS